MKQYSFIAPSKPNYEKYVAYLREKKSSAIILHDIMKAEDYRGRLKIIGLSRIGENFALKMMQIL